MTAKRKLKAVKPKVGAVKCPRCRRLPRFQPVGGWLDNRGAYECKTTNCMMGCWGGKVWDGSYSSQRAAAIGWNRWCAKYKTFNQAQRIAWSKS